MENSVMKIVFIDAQNRSIRIIDRDKVREYDWNYIDDIANEISSRNVLYITSLEQKNGSDIIDLISRNTGKVHKKIVKTGRKMIREIKAGRIIVQHQDPEQNPLIFNSPIDFKPYSEQLEIDYPNIERYIEIGKLEIVDEGDISRIKKEYVKVADARKSKNRKTTKREEDPNSILISESVSSLSERIESEGYEGDSDYEPLDITDDVLKGSSSREDEEFFKTAKAAGIDTSDMEE